MLNRLAERRLLVPTLMVAVMLPVLIGLGLWQLDRRQWKEGLLRDLAARAKAPPVAIETLLGPDGDLSKPAHDLEYLAVSAQGHFHHDKESYIYAPDPALGPGVHVVTPFELASGRIVLVNRGFVPDAKRDPASRAEGLESGPTEIYGLVRTLDEPRLFTPAYDAGNRLWFWRDYDGMIAHHFSAPPPQLRLFLDATLAAPGGWPQGSPTRLDLPNRHLEYALTWFGLAIALLAIYVMFAMSRLRPSST